MTTYVRDRTSYLAFPAHLAAVPCGRLHTRQMLAEWGLAGISADAETVVTELLSNAVKATAPALAEAVILYLAANSEHVTIIVWDPSQHLPQRRAHDSESVDGRGLDIVEAVSAQWGSIPTAQGKLVWARLTHPSDTGHP